MVVGAARWGDDVLRELLSLDDDELARLRADGAI